MLNIQIKDRLCQTHLCIQHGIGVRHVAMNLHQVLLFEIITCCLRRKGVNVFERQQIHSVFEAKGVIARIGEVEFSFASERL